jgi:hypothetical protein
MKRFRFFRYGSGSPDLYVTQNYGRADPALNCKLLEEIIGKSYQHFFLKFGKSWHTFFRVYEGIQARQ